VKRARRTAEADRGGKPGANPARDADGALQQKANDGTGRIVGPSRAGVRSALREEPFVGRLRCGRSGGEERRTLGRGRCRSRPRARGRRRVLPAQVRMTAAVIVRSIGTALDPDWDEHGQKAEEPRRVRMAAVVAASASVVLLPEIHDAFAGTRADVSVAHDEREQEDFAGSG
jgi:hypothetical protein